MKTCVLSLALVLLAPSVGTARGIPSWSYGELYEKADLVAIVEFRSIAPSKEKLSGHGDTERYDGKVARLAVGKVLKGNAEIKTVDLLHFVYSKKATVYNGATFLDFSDGEKYQYLVFLRKSGKRSFIPVSGQYDAEVSVKKIVNDNLSSIETETEPQQEPERDK